MTLKDGDICIFRSRDSKHNKKLGIIYKVKIVYTLFILKMKSITIIRWFAFKIEIPTNTLN